MNNQGTEDPRKFVKRLAENGLVEHRKRHELDSFDVHWLDLTGLKLNASIYTPFLIPKRLPVQRTITADQVIAAIREAPTTAGGRRSNVRVVGLPSDEDAPFSVLVIGGLLVGAGTAFWQRTAAECVALVDRATIESMFEARAIDAKFKILCAALVKSLGPITLSPYNTGRQPVHGSRFFGRARLLQRVAAAKPGGSFTIVGNRRIGKTSLLREIKHRMRLQYPDISVADIYGSLPISSTEQLLEAILEQIVIDPTRRRGVQKDPVKRFRESVHEIAAKGHVALYIDELDRLLELDELQNWEIMRVLHATFLDHPRCWSFFAGFRRTIEARSRDDNPLYNFGGLLVVKRLSREDTIDMIVRPLELLGIDVASTDLPLDIYRESGGQPELVQMFGREIIHYFAKYGRPPRATDLVPAVLDTEEFHTCVNKAFLQNTSPMEKLACYLLIEDARRDGRPIEDFEFALRDLDNSLHTKGYNFGIEDLESLADHLKVSGIITPIAGAQYRYQFSVPQLARSCLNLDLEFAIRKAVEKIENSPDRRSALLDPEEPD